MMHLSGEPKETKTFLDSFRLNCYIPKINVFESLTEGRYTFENHAEELNREPRENSKLRQLPSYCKTTYFKPARTYIAIIPQRTGL